jgi:uroporphyrinogen III methyltransferase/synthase
MSVKKTSEQKRARRVLVTRAAGQAAPLLCALAALGFEPVAVPTIAIVPPTSFAELDRAIAELDRTDYLVLTSANAVDAFCNRLEQWQQELPPHLSCVAVGPKSAAAMQARGLVADLIPEDYRAEGVVALLKERVAGKRVLYPQAALARELIPTALAAAGAEVSAPVAYASAPPAGAKSRLAAEIEAGLDLLTFTASSTVENFVALLDAAELARARQIAVASIGPLTTATAERLGFKVVIEPDNSTLDDMVEAISNYFGLRP